MTHFFVLIQLTFAISQRHKISICDEIFFVKSSFEIFKRFFGFGADLAFTSVANVIIFLEEI